MHERDNKQQQHPIDDRSFIVVSCCPLRINISCLSIDWSIQQLVVRLRSGTSRLYYRSAFFVVAGSLVCSRYRSILRTRFADDICLTRLQTIPQLGECGTHINTHTNTTIWIHGIPRCWCRCVSSRATTTRSTLRRASTTTSSTRSRSMTTTSLTPRPHHHELVDWHEIQLWRYR